MHILYGTPLPPGLVAPTKGELRLRVEQLILDDEVINHNPLVQLFDASEANSNARGTTAAESSSAAAAARSPNRFVVPIDHCAVGPIFWGETRPSAHGQPATPQLRRGPVIMTYPIKMDAEQFGAYLERMTASPQRGVQVDVFVPSSYSGRPPVTVGRCRVALDQLHPGHAVHGWFPVVHRRTRLSSEDAGPYRLAEVPIGKVKLTASVVFYPTSQRASTEPATVGAAAAAAFEKKHKRHLEGKDGGRAPLPQAKTRRSLRHPGRTNEDAAHPPTETSSSSTAPRSTSSSTTPTHTDVEQVQLRGGRRLRGAARGTDLVRDKTTSTQQLLKLGLRLRAQMQAAARGLAFDEDRYAHDGTLEGATHPGNATDVADFADDGEDGIANDEVGSAASYTSEDSDGEKFALQMQKDAEARDQRRPVPPPASPSSTPARPLLVEASALKQPEPQQHAERPWHGSSSSGVAAAPGLRCNSDASESRGRCATVELSFSSFSFAQTPLTADLQQLRINVRLSSDIATLEPSSGPLSSFVHPVPVLQPSICLLFDVCSFSEDRSKLVVEAYKVTNEVELESEEGGWGAQGPRQVAKEELLGLSVVGLYRQSRAVVFRDPVLDTNNVFAQLDVHVGPRGGDVGTASALQPPNTILTPRHAHPQVTLSGGQQGDSSSTGSSTAPAAAEAAQHCASKSAATPVAALSGNAAEPHAKSSGLSPPLRIANVPEVKTARCRLRVMVHSAAELPRVAVAAASRRNIAGSSFPIVSARPRSLPEGNVNGAMSYAEPNSFVTIEDVYRVAVGVCGMQSPLTAPPASLRAAEREAVDDWYVDEARGGFFDRSAVAEASSSPDYGYAATLQLPELKLPAKTARAASGSGSGVHGVADVLEELQLGMWHSDLSHRSASLNGAATAAAAVTGAPTPAGQRGGRGRRQEEAFWAAAAYMGTCRVDLRPLRYLKLLDGYYRVVCERTPGSAMGPSSAEAEASTIGYVRLSVSLL